MAAQRKPSRPPATTPQGRENQIIGMAEDLAEKQIREGTVSSQVLTHYLKLGASRERLEQQKIAYETELLKARTDNIVANRDQDGMYQKALDAMRAYSGQHVEEDYEEYTE